MKYFTSDTHFGHSNVIRYCTRPFVDVIEMNRVMLSNMQQVLCDDDELYFLGDWCMNLKYYSMIKDVPFKHLYFVLGNHDKSARLSKQIVADGIESQVSVVNEMTVRLDGRDFFLVHRPVMGSDSMPTLCGHVHEKWRFQPPGVELREYKYKDEHMVKTLKQPVLNVGVDQHDFRPISEEEVLEFFTGF